MATPVTFTRSAVIAGALSGILSTVHALVTGRDPLEATRAAGTIVFHDHDDRGLLVAGGLVHGVLTVAWTAVARPLVAGRRHRVAYGAALGLLIGSVDLAIAEWRYPRVAQLPTLAQLADHAAFGALVGATTSTTR